MINKFLRLPIIPILFKTITFLSLVLLVINGLSATSDDAAFLKILRNTNWANLIVWSYWWPFIIITAVLFGRIWCMVCPVETITTTASKFGFRKKVPPFLKSGWGITIFYILILFVGIQGLSIHRDPSRMALYLIMLIAISILTGFIFEKNAFCAHFCPVGFLLGLYARLSPFGWRVFDKDVCKKCKDKSCIHRDNQYRVINKSCGVNLNPPNIKDNSECILCTGCMKACEKYNKTGQGGRPNPGFRFTGLGKTLRESWEVTPAIAGFVLIVAGFVIYEILSEWSGTKQILMVAPKTITDLFAVNNSVFKGLIKSTILFFLFPLAIVAIPYIISSTARKKIGFGTYLLSYLTALVPIMAAAHIGKSLLKMASRIPYLSIIGEDIAGLKTAEGILNNSIVLQNLPGWIGLFLTITLIFLLSVGFYFSIKMIHNKSNRLFPEKKPTAIFLLPVLYGSIFIITIFAWRII